MANETIKALLMLLIFAVLGGTIYIQELTDRGLQPIRLRRRKHRNHGAP